jgi:alpha-beta hydrolase superfamily lysophospholipase
MGKTMAWIGSHLPLALGLGLLLAFVVLNVLAYRHVWTMTHFIPAGGWRFKPAGLTRRDKLRAVLAGIHLCKPALDQLPSAFGLSWETHTFPGPRGRLEAWYIPHPNPSGFVLLFHGYHACKARLLHEVRALHELGLSCFLLDFPGCGGSFGDATSIGFLEAADVACAVEYVRHTWGDQPLTLFGQSMGAAAVLRAVAVHGVEADALILESPFDRLLTTVKARFRFMGLPSFPAAHLMVFWGGMQLGYNGFGHNPVAYARRVKCPVLLMYGSDDRWVRAREIETVYAAFPGDKQFHRFAGVGHESYAAVRPDEWKSCVAAFLHSRAPAH